MARIRKVEIENFRGIKSLTWLPSEGINCLIGPGDSGKSSILDAIDLCLGARRNLQFTDVDFHNLQVGTPIRVSITVGELDDALKSIDSYGLYLRSFDAATGEIQDEPEKDGETVLTVELCVESDLEPLWTLISDRAVSQGQSRNLSWSDRIRLAPTRIGSAASYHLGWRKGSVLNKLTDEEADSAAALVKAGRDARTAFGEEAQQNLAESLKVVASTAQDLGITIEGETKALLDAHSVSFTGGTISLHDGHGVPLRGLGMGSARLLIAGLQKRAANQATIALIDELEHGLEPHRLIHLLGSLGAKDTTPPLQVFMTTHSPVALRELSGTQLFVTRKHAEHSEVLSVGSEDIVQGTIRKFPEAFLAPSVLICEGASEVGLVRGLDQYRVSQGLPSILSHGTALVDGGGANNIYRRNDAFRTLGYRTAILRDDDVRPDPDKEQEFLEQGGTVISWDANKALEDALFTSLSDDTVIALIDRAIALHGEEIAEAHIKTASSDTKTLAELRTEHQANGLSYDARCVLGKASRFTAAWFKTVTRMEDVARDIVGPDLHRAAPEFQDRVQLIFGWSENAG